MTKKITKLTDAQKARLPEWRDKWIEIGLRTGEADWEKFGRGIRVAYEKAGIPFPEKIIRVPSPIVGAFAAAAARRILGGDAVGDAVRDAVDHAVRDAVRSAAGGAVDGAVGDAVGDAVRHAVDHAVGDAVYDAVRSAGSDAVDHAVGDAVSGAAGGAVDGAVSGAVGDAVSDAVGRAVSDAVGDAVGDTVGRAVSGAVRGAVDGAVRDAVDHAVGDAVYDAVRSAGSDAVDHAVGDAVSGAVYAAVDGTVGGAVGGAVGDAVGGAVDHAVSDAVRGAVRRAVRTKELSWHSWLGGQFWVGGWWGSPAFVSFFTEVCGLEFLSDIQERVAAYRDICESVNYIWPNQNFVMVCERPVAIRRNHEGQLSSDQKMAIEYPDGWGLYALDGVVFEKDLWERVVSQTMTLTELFAIENADQRAVAISYNPKAIIASGAEMIDSHPQHGDLYLLQNTEFNKYCGHKKAYFLRMDCPTGREFIEAVPPDVAEKTPYAMHCQAAAFGVPVEIFQGLLPQNAG